MFVMVGSIVFYTNMIENNLINKLSAESDLDIDLAIGSNRVAYTSGSGDGVISLTYRQKYIGV